MPRPLVLRPEECRHYSWHPPQDFSFARQQALVPLHAGELARAAAAMPLAIVSRQRQWQLVGVCGTEPGHNLFVKDGRWLGHYQPQWLASHPFESLTVGRQSLVIVSRQNDLVDAAGAGDSFFSADGQMTPAVAQRVEAVKTTHRQRQATQQALEALAAARLLAPWPRALQSRLGMAHEGLYCIDEPALATLSDAAFLELRRAGALPLAYAVNVSLSQSHLLTRLERINPARFDAPEHLESFFGEDEDLSFDFDD